MIITIEEFFKYRDQLPMVDVRSEKEYGEGHIRGAVNIPILNDQERVLVGTDYKQRGQQEAIKTGVRLVGPRIIDIINEAEKVSKGNEMLVHCWRGGMRSANFCKFVEMARIKTHQLKGGYKGYRHEVVTSFERPLNLQIISGFTGSGKTDILRELERNGEQVIDLEKLSNHKGSVFGGLMQPHQPTTEQFQNNLFERIRQLDLTKPIWVEDESITIGNVVLPEPFWRQMCNSLVIHIDADRETRVQRLVEEYGKADKQEFLDAMSRIVKKLGGQHFQAAKEKLLAGDMASTIDILLNYYDKSYSIGLSKKQNRIKARFAWNGNSIEDIANRLRG
ncbi:tRNA 2-selenouridine(34) synthase MnmH [Chryseosolibacter indicus]|uniref:tRNA 2-selenouridine(34) synthase MnmH n=1 Tax=Chryseosolibacter indicus TaxID=2782351 RepID=A0ABS5VU63_9BACT|nr:tRNA 2-selenouridine(34) synthase MnmH [Chryseosolibacter indicus]